MGASVEAIVGTRTSDSSAGWATAFAVSSALPPPTPTTASAPCSDAAAATRSISSGEHSPPNSATCAPATAPTASPTTSRTAGSSRTSGAFAPMRSSSAPSVDTAPRPWMYRPGAAKTANRLSSVLAMDAPPEWVTFLSAPDPTARPAGSRAPAAGISRRVARSSR